uniref:Uncharacterized protein n=1 Tax=Rhizophora mucronata TaxID=61149 RepID=A0A2P2Q5U8_RHIMU
MDIKWCNKVILPLLQAQPFHRFHRGMCHRKQISQRPQVPQPAKHYSTSTFQISVILRHKTLASQRSLEFWGANK